MNTYSKIRTAMRQNERELLHHLRKYRVTHTSMFGLAWHKALDRLMAAKKVAYRKGRYVAVKNARPVTPWQRPTRARRSAKQADVVAANIVAKSPRMVRDAIRNTRRLHQDITLHVKVNGAGSFQMSNPNSRTRHWERSSV